MSTRDTARNHHTQAAMLAATLSILIAAISAQGDVFSVDAASPSWSDPADLLNPGPLPHVPAGYLGVVGRDLDALSQGMDIVTLNDIIYFSVDRSSIGMPGTAVYQQSTGSVIAQQASDIYVTVHTPPVNSYGHLSAPQGDNALIIDEAGNEPMTAGLGLLPDNRDNVDAYSMEEFDYYTRPGYTLPRDGKQDVSVFYSLDPVGGVGGADLWMSPKLDQIPSASLFMSSTTMGLAEGDDIDALALNAIPYIFGEPNPVNRAYYSLAPGSPSLAAWGASPADVFYTEFDGTSILAYSAASLGLLLGDNVDALETNALPEPVSLSLLAAGLALYVPRRRRRIPR